MARQRRSYASWFDDAVKRLRSLLPASITLRPLLHEGSLSAALARLSLGESGARLILGTVGADAHPGLLVGGTAEAVLAHGLAEVVLVKPANFVTPLQFAARGAQPLQAAGGVDV
jgi:hypothetical protein